MIKKFKKPLAGILAAALVFSMAPVTESTVEAADLPLLLWILSPAPWKTQVLPPESLLMVF